RLRTASLPDTRRRRASNPDSLQRHRRRPSRRGPRTHRRAGAARPVLCRDGRRSADRAGTGRGPPPRLALLACDPPLARRVGRRLPAERVKLLGLPVDLRFRPPAPGEKQALRRRFGLDEHRFTVLVMGGAAGVGHLAAQVRVLATEPHPWQLAVVCGRNDKLRRRLVALPAATPMLVFGFVDYMPELKRA